MNDDVDDIRKLVTEKNLFEVNHYKFFQGWDTENSTIIAFNIREIPFVALINE